MKKGILKVHLTIILVVISVQLLHSQQNILYFMNGIHQSSEMNPAYQNPCGGFLGLPGISGINLNVSNTGFTYNDLIRPGTGLQKDSFIVDIDNVKNKLSKNNYLLPEANISILGIGFWAGKNYITFGISNKTRSYFAYTDELLQFFEGNSNHIGKDNPINLSNLGPNFINYNEVALGLSRQLTSRLTVGGRAKVLFGTAAISKKKTDLKLYTASEEENYALRLETDIEINASGPFKVKRDANNKITDVELDEDNAIKAAYSTKNMGLGIDLGATYQLNDKIKIYASATDLGFIKWGNKTFNFTQKGSFNYEGATVDSLWSDNNKSDLVKEMTDSIKNFFEPVEKNEKFTTWLNTNIFIGGTYELTKGINIGLLSKTMFYNRKVHQGIILSANLQPTKWFTAAFSYSMINHSYNNFGVGFGLKLGSAQLYLLTDYINSIKVKDTKTVGVQLGLNFYFGCKNRVNLPVFGG